jgi:hypothetical protein
MERTLSISEAAEASGLRRAHAPLLRADGVARTREAQRERPSTLPGGRLERITFLTKLRATGMPIRELRRYAELMKDGEATNEERLALLEAHRDHVLAGLEATARNLELVERKIGVYKEKLGRE